MPEVNIPNMRRDHSLPELVNGLVGDRLDVWVQGQRSDGLATQHFQMINEAVADVFRRVGQRSSDDLELICVAVARVAVGRILSSPGFEIRLGDNPLYREVINVQLRDPQPTVRTAGVSRHSNSEGSRP